MIQKKKKVVKSGSSEIGKVREVGLGGRGKGCVMEMDGGR